MRLRGRVVLITGGSKRVGKAIAITLAERGACIAFTYRSSRREAASTSKQIELLGTEALTIRADLSSSADVKRIMSQIERHFSRLDVLINSAANFVRTPFPKLTERNWDAALDTNLKGPFLCALFASRLMLKRGGGKIINFADWAAERPYRNYLPYCVSKAGVIGLTKALAKELAPRIQVNAIAPGPILPPSSMSVSERCHIARRTPLKHWGGPEEIANAVVFLIEGTDFMTGSTLFVDGGQLIA